jgi:hypothetical protein
MLDLSSPEVRNWISTVVGVIIICGIFGSDLLHFHQVGAIGDVGIIVGAVGALGVHASFQVGKGAS